MLVDLLKFLVKYPFAASAKDARAMKCMALDKDIALVAGADGFFLINRNDAYVGKSLEIYGEYAGLEGRLLKSLVQPGQTVVEVGANIGSHTVGLAKRVGPAGKVFAFEPQRACFALLQSQIALNQLRNVVALNEGSGASDCEMWLPEVDYSAPGNFGGVSLQRSGPGLDEKVKVRRLDDVLPGTPVHLVKIDVEGMEQEVLEGAGKLIESSRPILYVENDQADKSAGLISWVRDHGYRLWWHIPPLFNPDNFFRVEANEIGPFASFNMLCVHRSSQMNTGGLEEIEPGTDRHPLIK